MNTIHISTGGKKSTFLHQVRQGQTALQKVVNNLQINILLYLFYIECNLKFM